MDNENNNKIHRPKKIKIELYDDNYANFKRYALRAAYELGRTAYGFEVDKKFYKDAKEKMLNMDVLNNLNQETTLF